MRCQNTIECSIRQQPHLRSCKRTAVKGDIFCDTCSRAISADLSTRLLGSLQTLIGGKIFATAGRKVA